MISSHQAFRWHEPLGVCEVALTSGSSAERHEVGEDFYLRMHLLKTINVMVVERMHTRPLQRTGGCIKLIVDNLLNKKWETLKRNRFR